MSTTVASVSTFTAAATIALVGFLLTGVTAFAVFAGGMVLYAGVLLFVLIGGAAVAASVDAEYGEKFSRAFITNIKYGLLGR